MLYKKYKSCSNYYIQVYLKICFSKHDKDITAPNYLFISWSLSYLASPQNCSLGVRIALFSELGYSCFFFYLSLMVASPLSPYLAASHMHSPSADLTCEAGNKQTPSGEVCSPLAYHCLLHQHRKFTAIHTLCSLSISIQQAEIIITMETVECSSQSRALIPNSEQMYSLLHTRQQVVT